MTSPAACLRVGGGAAQRTKGSRATTGPAPVAELYHVRLNFSGPLGRRSSISLRFQAAKQARSGFSKCFHALSSVFVHDADSKQRIIAWRAKKHSIGCKK